MTIDEAVKIASETAAFYEQFAQPNNKEARALRVLLAERETTRARIADLEGEGRVLIGCPCECHNGWLQDHPHRDCRECVRGTATPSAIDHDHEWALWYEKWKAQVDVTASYAVKLSFAEQRAEAAEAKLVALEQEHAQHVEAAAQRLEQAEANCAKLSKEIVALEREWATRLSREVRAAEARLREVEAQHKTWHAESERQLRAAQDQAAEAEARLRKVEAELGHTRSWGRGWEQMAELAQAEVRKLREALEGIEREVLLPLLARARHDWQAGSGGDAETLRGVLASIRRRARAALASAPAEGGER